MCNIDPFTSFQTSSPCARGGNLTRKSVSGDSAFDQNEIVLKFNDVSRLADILSISLNRTNREVDKETSQALKAYMWVLRELVEIYRTDLSPAAQKMFFEKMARKLIDGAKDELSKKGVMSADTLSTVAIISKNILESELQSWSD